MKMKNRIRVAIGSDIKRESVMISSSGEVIAEGTSSRQLLKEVYDK